MWMLLSVGSARWNGNIAVHVQLPPVLTPLREILDGIFGEKPGGSQTWAKLVAVAEALEALLQGDVLAHLSDVVALSQGGADTSLLQTGGLLKPNEACCNKFANGQFTCCRRSNKQR